MKLLHTVCLLSAVVAWARGDAPTPAITLIKAGHLVDVRGGRTLDNQRILIDGQRIKAVGPDLAPPEGAVVLDLSNAWVLPGLIDCHTHVSFEIEDYSAFRFRKSPIDNAVYAHVYARRTLEAGFTSCRDVGAPELIDVALKRVIDQGKIPGPRLWVAGLGLSATGGHGDAGGLSPYFQLNHLSGVVDGVGEIRKKIRWNVKYGADLIKFSATAGVLSEEESVAATQFSAEEMKAIVDEAAMWEKKVAAHAHGAEGIKRAVQAGVASIEHGSLLDDEGITLMKKHGTFLVPTVFAGDAVVLYGKKWNLPQRLIEKAKTINAKKNDNYRKAIQAGVKIAYGTDAAVFPHGQNAADFRLLVDLGMTPMQALQSATTAAAELLGQSPHLGALEPGKWADLIAVSADPLKDIRVLENIPFVMKGGVVYKDRLNSRPESSRNHTERRSRP